MCTVGCSTGGVLSLVSRYSMALVWSSHGVWSSRLPESAAGRLKQVREQTQCSIPMEADRHRDSVRQCAGRTHWGIRVGAAEEEQLKARWVVSETAFKFQSPAARETGDRSESGASLRLQLVAVLLRSVFFAEARNGPRIHTAAALDSL
jgi:hypothetical protein